MLVQGTGIPLTLSWRRPLWYRKTDFYMIMASVMKGLSQTKSLPNLQQRIVYVYWPLIHIYGLPSIQLRVVGRKWRKSRGCLPFINFSFFISSSTTFGAVHERSSLPLRKFNILMSLVNDKNFFKESWICDEGKCRGF